MSLPKYIETNWCSKGKAVLSFISNEKHLKENDIVVYLSTLYIKEFEEEPKLPCEECDTDNLNASDNDIHFIDQEYVCPPGISSELWQDWLVYWERWKEIYIPLAWVEKYRSVCTPEYVSWHDDYLKDFPSLLPCIQEGLDIENKTQNPDFEKSKNGAIAADKKDDMTVKGTKEDWEMINSEETEEKYISDEKIENSSKKDGQESSDKAEMDKEYEMFSKQRFWIHMWIFLHSAGIEGNEELSMYFMSKAKYEIKNTGPISDIYSNDTEEQNTPIENSDAIRNTVEEVNSCQFENISKKDGNNDNFSKNIENKDNEKLDVYMEEKITKDRIDGETIEEKNTDLENKLIESTKTYQDVCNDENYDCEENIDDLIESLNGNEKAADDDLINNENNKETVIEDKLSPRGQKRHMEEIVNEDGEFLGKMIIDIKSDSKKSKKNQINQKLSSGISWAMKYIVKESNETECPFKVSDISQDLQITSEQSKDIISEDDVAESANIFSEGKDMNIKSPSSSTTLNSSNEVDGNDFSEDNDFTKADNTEENNTCSGDDHHKTKKKGKKYKNKSKKTDGALEKVQPWWWFRMGRSVNTFFHWCTSRIFRIMVSSIESIVSVIFPAWLQRVITFGSAWKAVEKPTAILNKWLRASTSKPSSTNTIIMLPNLYLNYISNEIDERMPQTVYQSVDVENDKVYVTNLQLDRYEESPEEEDEDAWTRTHVVFDEDGNPQSVATTHSSNNYDERTVINRASDIWKEMLQGHQMMEYSIVKDAPAHLPKKLLKYWAQRYRLFLKFDQGIQMDEESWYSVTPEVIAAHHAYRCTCDVVVDAFCGSGGNAIQLAYTCNQVIAVDIDPNKIKLARHNAEVYGVAHRIQFIVGDFFKLAPSLKANVVHLSPPWGGIEYLSEGIYNVSALGGFMDSRKLMDAARAITDNIALYLPRTSDLYQVIQLAGAGGSVDIEANMMGRKKKAITAYYGDLVNIDVCE